MFATRLHRSRGLRAHPLALLSCLLLASATHGAPTQVAARYADGQVWVSWNVEASPPQTYAIYSAPAPFTRTQEARLEGRLFAWEWSPAAAAAQTDSAVTRWRIPDGAGGVDTMAAGRGLFVSTVHSTETRYWAVVRWGDTLVTPQNRSAAVAAIFSVHDPPECHLQHEYVKSGQFLVRLYAMWADGREDHRDHREGFPVMANQHKNGMPSIFFVSRRLTATATPRPVTYWLHGGDGRASQSLPGSRTTIGIDPADGLLVAHNDDFVFRSPYAPDSLETEGSNSWWFGWTSRHDPFDPGFAAAPGDTVINYTQRRLMWIHGWLIAHEGADPDRTAVQGHSVGSAGTTALAKVFPSAFSTATLYNNGLLGPRDGPPPNPVYGTSSMALPSSVPAPDGSAVPFHRLFDLTTRAAGARDLPLMRVFHGKTDANATMQWSAEVVAQYRAADSIGLGMHLYWDERGHGLADGAGHWFYGPGGPTRRDDVAAQEAFRRDRSFPAFFDHRLDVLGGNPGDGTRGTMSEPPFSGDDWGTWGGYHDHDPSSVLDLPARWEADLFLTQPVTGGVDVCPHESLTCAVSIRRPQSFLPPPGSLLRWALLAPDGDTLATDTTRVDASAVVSARGITLRKDQRRRLMFTAASAVTTVEGSIGAGGERPKIRVEGPANASHFTVRLATPTAGRVTLDAHDISGRRVTRLVDRELAAGEHETPWQPVGLSPGVYLLRLATPAGAAFTRFAWLGGRAGL